MKKQNKELSSQAQLYLVLPFRSGMLYTVERQCFGMVIFHYIEENLILCHLNLI